jgi:TPP-dependent trihydroxycyclohexane-1,2-dione (THcHDO) dehydratase
MATDIRDEAALRAMAALVAATNIEPSDVARRAFDYAEEFLAERKHRADIREAALRAKFNHD